MVKEEVQNIDVNSNPEIIFKYLSKIESKYIISNKKNEEEFIKDLNIVLDIFKETDIYNKPLKPKNYRNLPVEEILNSILAMEPPLKLINNKYRIFCKVGGFFEWFFRNHTRKLSQDYLNEKELIKELYPIIGILDKIYYGYNDLFKNLDGILPAIVKVNNNEPPIELFYKNDYILGALDKLYPKKIPQYFSKIEKEASQKGKRNLVILYSKLKPILDYCALYYEHDFIGLRHRKDDPLSLGDKVIKKIFHHLIKINLPLHYYCPDERFITIAERLFPNFIKNQIEDIGKKWKKRIIKENDVIKNLKPVLDITVAYFEDESFLKQFKRRINQIYKIDPPLKLFDRDDSYIFSVVDGFKEWFIGKKLEIIKNSSDKSFLITNYHSIFKILITKKYKFDIEKDKWNYNNQDKVYYNMGYEKFIPEILNLKPPIDVLIDNSLYLGLLRFPEAANISNFVTYFSYSDPKVRRAIADNPKAIKFKEFKRLYDPEIEIDSIVISKSLNSLKLNDPKAFQKLNFGDEDTNSKLKIYDILPPKEKEALLDLNKVIGTVIPLKDIAEDEDDFDDGYEIPYCGTINNRIIKLGLTEKNIKILPESIGNLSKLQILDLELNSIEELPNSIGNLCSLKTFLLGNNKIKKIPESFVKLKNLEFLYLGNNLLNKIPELLLEQNKLKILSLQFNNLNKEQINKSIVYNELTRRKCKILIEDNEIIRYWGYIYEYTSD